MKPKDEAAAMKPEDEAAAMKPEDVHERVRADGLLGSDRPVVAMISGGRDSVCLLDVAVALRGAGAVRALHVDYGLRGAASHADADHCRRLCEQLGVQLELVSVGEQQRAQSRTGNLQAWARELRYGAAQRLAQELDAGRTAGDRVETADSATPPSGARSPSGALIATGHTASDQVETILYRLAASPSRRALLGMAPREGRIIRPLLWLTREQTAAYCRARGLEWREDESNADERYARARVRNSLVPALRSVHPAAEQSVLRTAALLREEAELLDGLVEDELRGRGEIETARLAEVHPALARLIVVRLAEDAAGGYVPQAGTRVEEILALAGRGGGGEVHVGGNLAARVSGGVVRMVRLPPRT